MHTNMMLRVLYWWEIFQGIFFTKSITAIIFYSQNLESNFNNLKLSHRIQSNTQKKMQVFNNLSPQFNQFMPNLHKNVSMPTFQTQPLFQGQISDCFGQVLNEGYWRNAIKWIMKLRKRCNISKPTLYLAVTYLIKIVLHSGCQINQNNCQKIAVVVVMISAKMNEIYPPKMSTLLDRCTKYYSKDQIIEAEGDILKLFNYDMTFTQTAYTHLLTILKNQTDDKIDDAEKLLGLALTQKKIASAGQEVVSLAIVYLIKPILMRQCGYENMHKIKTVANKIYNLYISNRSKN